MNYGWLLSDLKKVPQNGLKVFSTFACGGGSTMGYKLAGCEVIGANDIDPEMAWHYRLNHKPKHYFLCSIRKLIGRELDQEFFDLDILDGSPPCSSFSTAGNREKDWGRKKHFREGQTKQVLDTLFFDYIDLAEYLKPKIIVAENVKGLLLGNAKSYTKKIITRLKEIGYKPQLFLINAADCGVPQRRERVFFVALRQDIKKPKLILKPKCRWITAREAIADVVFTEKDRIETKPTVSDYRYWADTNPGDTYERARLQRDGKMGLFCNIKINGDSPSSTLTSSYSNFTHWEVMRKLSFKEWKRLASFPDDYKARTPSIGKYMIGMSVPPKMTYQVAKAIISQWLT